MVNVEVTPLPGIGTRQDFQSRAGRRIGVITYRDGRLELIVSREDDPDTCTASIPLTVDEASALAGLLGAPQLVADLRKENDELPGVHTKQLPLLHGSPYDGRTLGDTAAAHPHRGLRRGRRARGHRAPVAAAGLRARRRRRADHRRHRARAWPRQPTCSTAGSESCTTPRSR